MLFLYKSCVSVTQNYMKNTWITVIWAPSSLFSPQSDRLWWGSAAWWRNPSQSQWPRFWRGCAGLSTSLWSSSQRMSSSTSPWTNGLCVTASSLSTPKVTVLLLSDIFTAHSVDLCKARFISHRLWELFTNERTPLLFTLSLGCCFN